MDVQVGNRALPCRIRGKFRLLEENTTNPVAVGDHVRVEVQGDETGVIVEILPRHNKLSRRAAGRRSGQEHVIVANVDAAWAIQAVTLPRLNPGFVDRLLVMAEAHEIPAGIVFNKTDLLAADDADMMFWKELYEDLGYPVLLTSAENGEGIEAFREELAGRTSVLAGPSGVGKSSLLNVVEPELGLRTGEVSEKTRKGRHTTTVAELVPLSFGGFVVDTPGIREFGLWDLAPEELSHFFVEMVPFLDECRYPSCTHDHEPECGVKQAVDEGKITEERYASYLNMLDSLLRGDDDVGR